MGIHPTALVEPGARVHAGAEIGPFCLIGREVTIGEGTILVGHVLVTGRSILGSRNTVAPYTVIGGAPQDASHRSGESRVFIGDDNTIGAGVTVNGGTAKGGLRTVLGHRNRIDAGAHVAHDCVLEDDCVVGDMGLLAGHVRVETGAVLGARSGVHQFATIGRLSAVGRAARVNQDVPPFTRVDDSASEIGGINDEGLRSKGVLEVTVAALTEAYRIVWREGLPKPEAIARVERSLSHVPLVLELVAFLKASDRGRMGRGRDAAPPANRPKG